MQNNFNGGTPGNGSESFEHLQFHNDVQPAVRKNGPPAVEPTGMGTLAWMFSTQQPAKEGDWISQTTKGQDWSGHGNIVRTYGTR